MNVIMIIRRDHNGQQGITFMEGVGVILFLLLIIAIAIPAFLGGREVSKTRALEAHARVMLMETEDRLQLYTAHEAMAFNNTPIVVNQPASVRVCYQSQIPAQGKDCATLYPDLRKIATYEGLDDIIRAITIHHNTAMQEVSLYDGEPLFNVTSTPVAGHVTLHSPDGESVLISAWYIDGKLIYNATAVANKTVH